MATPRKSDHKDDGDHKTKPNTPNIQDLHNVIKNMTSLFPEEIRPTAEETEAFNSCL